MLKHAVNVFGPALNMWTCMYHGLSRRTTVSDPDLSSELEVWEQLARKSKQSLRHRFKFPLTNVRYMFYCESREDLRHMDWARAVEINRIALTRIVAELLAMIGVMNGAAVERLLRPAESALRRLIVIAARGLVVKALPKRPMPKGLVIVSKGARPMTFRLFDKRQIFDFIKTENPLLVHVKTYESNPFNPFNSFYQSRPAEQDESAKATQLSRRLSAVAHALENLQQQARRMARWKVLRKTTENPKFTSPLRPGPPPGHRSKPTAEVDYVLNECHGLAWDALREESS
jgi:hypothetical protein